MHNEIVRTLVDMLTDLNDLAHSAGKSRRITEEDMYVRAGNYVHAAISELNKELNKELKPEPVALITETESKPDDESEELEPEPSDPLSHMEVEETLETELTEGAIPLVVEVSKPVKVDGRKTRIITPEHRAKLVENARKAREARKAKSNGGLNG